MPKSTYVKEEKFQEKVEVVETPVPDTIKEQKVRSRIESRLSYTGKVSGRLYEWSGAGRETLVLVEDIPDLLTKRLGAKTCCGNEENIIFELVQEA